MVIQSGAKLKAIKRKKVKIGGKYMDQVLKCKRRWNEMTKFEVRVKT
jgi:hypothetical protein